MSPNRTTTHCLSQASTVRSAWLSAGWVQQATVMAKVLYAASAWWEFTSASDTQRIEAFVGRAKRCGLCYADQPPVSSL